MRKGCILRLDAVVRSIWSGFSLSTEINQQTSYCSYGRPAFGAVIRPARFGRFRSLHYSDGTCTIHRQTSYDSVDLKEDAGVIRGSPTDGDQRNLCDSVVLTKETGVIQDLPINDDQWKHMELCLWPIGFTCPIIFSWISAPRPLTWV